MGLRRSANSEFRDDPVRTLPAAVRLRRHPGLQCPLCRTFFVVILLMAGVATAQPAAPSSDSDSAPDTGSLASAAAAGEANRVTAVFADAKIEDIALAIGGMTNRQITIYGAAKGKRVHLIANDVPFADAMNELCIPHDFVWWTYGEGKVAIADWDSFETLALRKVPLDEALENLAAQFDIAWEKTGEREYTIHLQSPLGPIRVGPELYAREIGFSSPETPLEPNPNITVAFNQARLFPVTEALRKQARRPIYARGFAYDQRVDVVARGIPLSETLEVLATTNDLVWWEEADGSLHVSSPDYFQRFVYKSTRLEDALRAIANGHQIHWWKENETVYRLGEKPAGKLDPSGQSMKPQSEARNQEHVPPLSEPQTEKDTLAAETVKPGAAPGVSIDIITASWQLVAVLPDKALFRDASTGEDFSLQAGESRQVDYRENTYSILLESVDSQGYTATLAIGGMGTPQRRELKMF